MKNSHINQKLSLFWVIGWVFFFSTSVTLAKKLDPSTPTLIIVFIRSLFGLISICPLMLRGNRRKNFRFQDVKVSIVKMISYFSAITCTYYAYRSLPLATATAIGFSGPIFITSFSIFILKEKIPSEKWLLLILGYLGVLVIIDPTTIKFSTSILISVLANIFAAISVNTTKILTNKNQTKTIIFYANTFNFLCSSILLLLFLPETKVDSKSLYTLPIIGTIGVCSSYCYVQSLKYSKPSFVAPFEYTRLVYAIPVGVIFFSEYPKLNTIIGSLVIIFATTLFTRFKTQEKMKKDITDFSLIKESSLKNQNLPH